MMENEKREECVEVRSSKVAEKEEYLKRISKLPAEDQAFLDGYLFAKVTELGKKGD